MKPFFELEFERQVTNLLKLDYPKLMLMSEEDFKKGTQSLKKLLEKESFFELDLEAGTLPFVVVVNSNLINAEQTIPLVVKDGKEGIVKLFPHTSQDFFTIKEVTIPNSEFYIIKNIDRGKNNINQPPIVALKEINNDIRSPLTINEGVAIVTHYPEFLMKNNCFSLLASRNKQDKRVPAIWINSNHNPNLGWCWDGNPHTWLGSASCAERLG
jgi:hypothetical protein